MFQSHWGFHPCDYSTYRKLKFLNQMYLQAVRLAHTWGRWYRKDPHNRVQRRRLRNDKRQTIGYESPVPLPEPKLCPVFSQKTYQKRHVDKKGHYSREGFLEEVVVVDGSWIAVDYALARKPAVDQAAVQPLHHTLTEVDELYKKARIWLEEQNAS